MTHIEQEKETIYRMVTIYCHGNKHCKTGLCKECSTLLEYAYFRLDHCKFSENKTTCRKCHIHCYKPEMREKICKVMKYAGPRMIWHHPFDALKHFFREMKKH